MPRDVPAPRSSRRQGRRAVRYWRTQHAWQVGPAGLTIECDWRPGIGGMGRRARRRRIIEQAFGTVETVVRRSNMFHMAVSARRDHGYVTEEPT